MGALQDSLRAQRLVEKLHRRRGIPVPGTESTLTPREMEVLQLVAGDLSDKEIATSLHLSEHTVHRHISNILTKLDVPSRAAAVAQVNRSGLL